MRELLSRTLVGLIAGVTFLWAALAAAQQYNGKELVKATLVADVSSIQPGQRFRLGVLYRIEPGWHIYWKYPGDSGIPTKIEWQLPQGFTIRGIAVAAAPAGKRAGRFGGVCLHLGGSAVCRR